MTSPRSSPFYGTSGPHDAKILVVGESWGIDEDAEERPLVGASGREFNRMCAEAGYDRNSMLCTNVIDDRPPGNEMFLFFDKKKDATEPPIRGLYPKANVRAGLIKLQELIRVVNPEIIIALGSYALWALSDVTNVKVAEWANGASSGVLEPTGIGNYRGSMLRTLPEYGSRRLLPLFHPALILRDWSFRNLTVYDMRLRLGLAFEGKWDRPAKTVIYQPTYEQVITYLYSLRQAYHKGGPRRLVADIETARRLMTCIGLSDRDDFAFTIPFIKLDPANPGRWLPRWTTYELSCILHLLRQALHYHHVEGQNFLYDIHFIARDFGVIPNVTYDTMVAQHVMLPGTPKSLAHLSSLYVEYHWFWKDDNKEWDLKGNLDDHLRYNAEDILRQWEVGKNQRPNIEATGKTWHFSREMKKYWLAIRMMFRGVLTDNNVRVKLLMENMKASGEIQATLLRIVPHHFVPNEELVKTKKSQATAWFLSPTKAKWVLFTHFRMKPKKSRKTGNITTGKEAINELRKEYPEYELLFDLLQGLRSLGIYDRNFLRAPIDYDGKIRTFFNPTGTETFRWSSSRNPHGIGTNLQNIPEGSKD